MIEEMYKEEFGAEMDSNSSSENGGGGGGKGKDEAISSEDRDEFQSPSSAAAARHAGVAGQLNNPFKSEAMGGAAWTSASASSACPAASAAPWARTPPAST